MSTRTPSATPVALAALPNRTPAEGVLPAVDLSTDGLREFAPDSFLESVRPRNRRLKVCDLTQFYSPVSGGVKRYLQEKGRFIREKLPEVEHLLIVPGEEDGVQRDGLTTTYTIASPALSSVTGYRMLLRLREMSRILQSERPDLIECGDPYQVGWRAAKIGCEMGIPTVAFYHSHFAETELRSARRRIGPVLGELLTDFGQRYTRWLYSRFDRTIVPSPSLAHTLLEWGVENVEVADLGVDIAVFRPSGGTEERAGLRRELGIPENRALLLYVGRLAPDKNTATLCDAYRLLIARFPDRFHLLVIGEGQQRAIVKELLEDEPKAVTWLHYSVDAHYLARVYRAADLFVHPGVEETFGLVALESQACGLPVCGIAGTRLDRIILHDQSFWARENHPVELAVAVEQAMTKDLRRIGQAASEAVAGRFSWDQVFPRLFAIYEKVVAEHRTR